MADDTNNFTVEPKPEWTVKEYFLYKLDRNFAIVGLIALGAWALWIKTTESQQIAMAAVGALAAYIGSRSGT